MQASEIGHQSQLESVLAAGLEALDLDQEIKFLKYTRVVLPIDGYVFWQRTVPFVVQGSLHHSREILQEEDQTVGLATCLFTTRQHLTEFAELPINSLFIARIGETRFAFSRQEGYYSEAGLWHYWGHSIFPVMESQLLDNPSSIDASRAIVSNSLPLWIAFNGYTSPLIGGFSNPVTLYPSKAVPANLPAPYGSVHIQPEWTQSLQAVPRIHRGEIQATDADGNPIVSSDGNPVLIPQRIHHQLMSDRVRIVLYGLQDWQAQEFYASVLEYMELGNGLGLMNTPSIMDGKREQVELQALAMQKIMEFEVSYHQHHVRSVAMQTIKSAQASFYLGTP